MRSDLNEKVFGVLSVCYILIICLGALGCLTHFALKIYKVTFTLFLFNSWDCCLEQGTGGGRSSSEV
jgi:hypothetical protein